MDIDTVQNKLTFLNTNLFEKRKPKQQILNSLYLSGGKCCSLCLRCFSSAKLSLGVLNATETTS